MYKLNNISLSTYGIEPGRLPGEGIAVKGIFDLPKRVGDTHYEWAESDGVQPYVDADEIFFGGRTLYFQGIMVGGLSPLKALLNTFKTAISSYTDLVPFETPYGSFCVLVKKVTPQFYNGGAIVLIEFYEPQLDANCSVVIPPTVYYSELYSETADKNNCAEGYYGSTVQLVSPEGKFTSTVSQEAANLLAKQWVRDSKQDYANAMGTCIINPTRYWNVEKKGTLQKNDCPSGMVGGMAEYIVPAYKYSSLISQEDADAKAQNEIDTNLTQAYANTNGSCVMAFWNKAYTFYRTKDDCPSGQIGSQVYYTVPAGMFSSTISQYDADLDAAGWAHMQFLQSHANAQGTCSFPLASSVINLGLQSVGQDWIRRWEIHPVLKTGSKFIFVAYGVSVTYTVQSGDTALIVANALVLAINSKSHGDWSVNNMFPLYSPTPFAVLDSSTPVVISVKLYQQANFNLYVQN